jgi:hypothetical protein
MKDALVSHSLEYQSLTITFLGVSESFYHIPWSIRVLLSHSLEYQSFLLIILHLYITFKTKLSLSLVNMHGVEPVMHLCAN